MVINNTVIYEHDFFNWIFGCTHVYLIVIPNPWGRSKKAISGCEAKKLFLGAWNCRFCRIF